MKFIGVRREHFVLALSLAAAVACTQTTDTGDTIPAQPGAVQPAGDGTAMDEAAACKAIADALSGARSTLGCGNTATECPDAIRPAGGQACLEYDKGSVDACVAYIAKYASCADIDQHPCIVTALTSTTAGCVGSGGTAGASGSAGASGTAGASGSGGSAGMSGASGSAGAGVNDAGTD